MKPWQIIAALILGFLLGGCAHLWFLGDVGGAALIAAGQSSFGFYVKTVGEGIGAGILFYLLGFCGYVFFACLIGSTMLVNGWWQWSAFPSRPALWPTLAMLLFGALGAVSLNQSSITSDYQHAATEERFAASTIAIALPPMQAFTADCRRAILALLVLLLLAWGGDHWRRHGVPAIVQLRGGDR